MIIVPSPTSEMRFAVSNMQFAEKFGVRFLASESNDPQMIFWDAAKNLPLELAPGTYKIIFNARLTQGSMQSPKLYFDFGQGFHDDKDSVRSLLRYSGELWGVVFNIKHKAIQVRFDPSEVPTGFILLQLDIDDESRFRLSHSQGLAAKSRSIADSLLGSISNNKLVKSTIIQPWRAVFGKEQETLEHISLTPEQIEASLQHTIAQLEPVEFESGKYHELYDHNLSVAKNARDASFAPDVASPTIVGGDEPKIIAYYLPQFHPFKENNEWWGEGFTEWTNVSKATAQFEGHYQPRLPGDLGHYDLRLPEIMAKQFEMARKYGVSGFCYHYYWFDGHRLMERPLETLLKQKGPEYDFPFCLCWANENWTRRWDGAEADVLMQQNHGKKDHARIIKDLLRYFKDSRYITIEGKPVIVIYRPTIIDELDEMVDIWRTAAKKAGYEDIYMVATTAFGFSEPKTIGFDAISQFPPHAIAVRECTEEVDLYNRGFEGKVYDYAETVEAFIECLKEIGAHGTQTAYFPGVMTGWDNEARKPGKGHVFHGATPKLFQKWLKYSMDWTKKHNKSGEQLVFVNAWNEWAEGTYLEPDRKFGHAFLHAIISARAEGREISKPLQRLAKAREKAKKTSDTAVYLHIFYPDLIDEFADLILKAKKERPLDVILSVPDQWHPDDLKKAITLLKPVRVILSINRGRDVWPFIQALRATSDMDYKYGCKLHSKKSFHFPSEGIRWRKSLTDGLLSPTNQTNAIAAMENSSQIGMVAPKEAIMSIKHKSVNRDNEANIEFLTDTFGLYSTPPQDFVAGTMFWIRHEAFEKITNSAIGLEDFEPELGAIDGTKAHAFERIVSTIVKSSGYDVATYSVPDFYSPY